MAITDWPSQERPREKLLHKGAEALSDAELLAIFFRIGVPGKSALDLAREVLNNAQGLRNLLEKTEQQFCQTKGMGLAKYVSLQAALEMGKRYLNEKLSRVDVLKNTRDTRRFLLAKLHGYQQEVFAGLFLDTQCRVISFEILFRGTINSSVIYPREIIKRVLHHNAANVIFAHNHPSGSTIPSEADLQVTQELKELLATLDVKLLDHLIIGGGEVNALEKLII